MKRTETFLLRLTKNNLQVKKTLNEMKCSKAFLLLSNKLRESRPKYIEVNIPTFKNKTKNNACTKDVIYSKVLIRNLTLSNQPPLNKNPNATKW